MTMWFTFTVFVIAFLTCTSAEDNSKNSDKNNVKTSLAMDCDNTFSVTCLKLNLVGWVDKLDKNEDYSVLPGITIVRENTSSTINNVQIAADLAREFPNDPEARIDAFLLNKVQGFLNSHSLKLNFAAEESNDENAVTSRKKSGKGGGIGILLAAGAMMKSTLVAIGLAALAAIAKKALITSVIALVLSVIIGLKALASGHSKTTYEVVSRPVYTHSSSHSSAHEDYHHGGHSDYGRSFDTMPLPLALQPGYRPA
ncbi:uncharacterized protein LOC130891499 [Diorhabda carinulata]|uniref:uncharacterized protein LOC130891499 n=1 Tax=Diorhabda carinulata TaxID=1163345 RepID=UPI00259FFCDF|nr:uncharacterized protein LOC130891499 [Diorhabda carinulata]